MWLKYNEFSNSKELGMLKWVGCLVGLKCRTVEKVDAEQDKKDMKCFNALNRTQFRNWVKDTNDV